YLHALLPRYPEVTPGEEASYSMSGQVVNPTFPPQLHHNCINPWEALIMTYLCPFGQCLWVVLPRNLHTDGVSNHTIEVWVIGSHCIKKLSP
ncbi:hypothetical protein EGW08_015235, partial [Elysia chlorotica]